MTIKRKINDLSRSLRQAIKLGNRGQAIGLNEMPQAFILLGVGVFAIVLVATLVQSLSDTQTAGSAAANISAQGLSAFTNAGTLFPILGLGVMAVVIIGVLFLIFQRR